MTNHHPVQKLLGRLCEQNRFLKDQEAIVHRLRMEKVHCLCLPFDNTRGNQIVFEIDCEYEKKMLFFAILSHGSAGDPTVLFVHVKLFL